VILVNVILRGKTKEIVELMVKDGYANSQSEAIRIAILNFEEKYLSGDEKVIRRLDNLDEEIKSGKKRLLGAKEALGEYSKFLK
jgi:Arc/MetJ-type ribon-helix-helix transcriptional regulator